MPRYVESQDRQQVTLLPECLDDFIGEDSPVRVVDAFVEELDLTTAGFDGRMVPALTGRPAYHPSVLLKVYIYGYLNRVQSSRRLERECQRNVELMWLTGRLAPDFKTIAYFRHDNGRGIRQACSQFVAICRKLKLLVDGVVAADGSKFKAVNNRDRNFTPHKLEQRMKQIQESIDRYLQALDTADRTQPDELPARTPRLQDKLGKLRRRLNDLREVEQQLQQTGAAQALSSLTRGREYEGLMPSHCSMASTVVAFKVEPLSPCRTGLLSKVAMRSASAVLRTRCTAWSASSLSWTSAPTILRLYRSMIRYRWNHRPAQDRGDVLALAQQPHHINLVSAFEVAPEHRELRHPPGPKPRNAEELAECR